MRRRPCGSQTSWGWWPHAPPRHGGWRLWAGTSGRPVGVQVRQLGCPQWHSLTALPRQVAPAVRRTHPNRQPHAQPCACEGEELFKLLNPPDTSRLLADLPAGSPSAVRGASGCFLAAAAAMPSLISATIPAAQECMQECAAGSRQQQRRRRFCSPDCIHFKWRQQHHGQTGAGRCLALAAQARRAGLRAGLQPRADWIGQ